MSTTASITTTAPSITSSAKFSRSTMSNRHRIESTLLPAVIITPIALIVCCILIHYRRKIFKSVENFNVKCCLKPELNIDMCAEYDEPYANDDYEMPYKLESDSNTRL